MAEWQRTHTCGELRETHIGQTVVLNGWVNTYRSYNDQIFVDLRDRYGLTQVVIESEPAELFAAAQEIRNEWVLSVRGRVRERLPGRHNPKLTTGDIEVLADHVHILNRCPAPPFEVMSVPLESRFSDPELAGEDLRLQYRFLDLRRPTLQGTLRLRHRLNKVIRDYLDGQGFLELETPLLGRSTPEGARDYLVPSRVSQDEKTGKPYWYALPQSPQLYKQLLMVAGYDKYFQIARCLRDEDLRADRQPEFTQLDLEMSFVEQNQVLTLIEGLIVEIFHKCIGFEIPLPFPRITYEESMLKYGNDKPDLRYGLEIVELSDLAAQTTFQLFQDAVSTGGKVRGLNARKAAEKFSRKDLDTLRQSVEGFSAKELIWSKVEGDKLPQIEKFLSAEVKQALRERMKAEAGDLLLFVADSEKAVCQSLSNLRTHIAGRVTGIKDWWVRRKDEEEAARKKKQPPPKFGFLPDDFKVAWLVDFPSFLWDDEEKRWAANHHPFTAPRDEDLAFLEREPAKVRAKAYDLVINGYEAGGGSIRIHNPEVQSRLFATLGMSPDQAQQRFGFLLDALKFGAPPHGGIALGLDRLTMILAGTTNIRDVIAFPKNQKARDLMTGAPASVDAKQLRELGL